MATYEIRDFRVDLSTYERGYPVELPEDWEPLAVERQANALAVVLVRRQPVLPAVGPGEA